MTTLQAMNGQDIPVNNSPPNPVCLCCPPCTQSVLHLHTWHQKQPHIARKAVVTAAGPAHLVYTHIMGSVLVAVSVEPTQRLPSALSRKSRNKSQQQLQASCLDPPSQLRSNLFIGSRETEQSLAALQAAGVTHILQAGVELGPSHPQQFCYQQLVCSDTDTQDIVSLFQQAFEFIDEGRQQGGWTGCRVLLAPSACRFVTASSPSANPALPQLLRNSCQGICWAPNGRETC